MKLTIDNFDGAGARDCTQWIDEENLPKIVRRLNAPWKMTCGLILAGSNFVVPPAGARVVLSTSKGAALFTGYLDGVPEEEYLGWNERGPQYRLNVSASSDDVILDRKTLQPRPAFVNCSAGGIVAALASDVAPGQFDCSGADDVESLESYFASSRHLWSEHAAQLALLARGCYRVQSGEVIFEPLGARSYVLNEADSAFSPAGLKLNAAAKTLNQITAIGQVEADCYVKDFFEGDGMSLRFYLSATPFLGKYGLILQQEYNAWPLDSRWWTVTDPKSAVSVNSGRLWIQGGTGSAGQTRVQFAQALELAGAIQLQHGDVTFQAPSSGVLGGLYAAGGQCLAGFQVAPSGAQSTITAVVNGAATGTPITTAAGHHYALTTRLFATEPVRRQQRFHSSQHVAGNAVGGAAVTSDLRVVLEMHDIDSNNIATQVAPAVVLYDGVLSSVDPTCSYVLADSPNLHCAIAYTRILKAPNVMVRSCLPSASYRTRLIGALLDGAECYLNSTGGLQFYSQSVPAANEKIVASYRTGKRSAAQTSNAGSIAALSHAGDDGIRSTMLSITVPAPRLSDDCTNATLALLEDTTQQAWSGEYDCWSAFLPCYASDILPGDAIEVKAPSRNCDCHVIVRAVEIAACDLAGDGSQYKIAFANEAAEPLAVQMSPATAQDLSGVDLLNLVNPTVVLPALTLADLVDVSSTTLTFDMGVDPPQGGGFEVRYSDSGWDPAIDRNLAARYTTRVFTIPRLSRVQSYFVRQYDNSTPVKYSKHSTLLHVDYPL